MEKRKEKLGFVMMFVFIVMNFVMSMSGTLFNGILDRIAFTMQIDVAMTGYLTSLYAYGAIGAPLLLLVFRKWSRSLMLKGTLLCNMLFGVLSIVATSFPLLFTCSLHAWFIWHGLWCLSDNQYCGIITA